MTQTTQTQNKFSGRPVIVGLIGVAALVIAGVVGWPTALHAAQANFNLAPHTSAAGTTAPASIRVDR